MSTATLSCISELSSLSLDSTALASSQATYTRESERWARKPITLLKRDVYSRFVLFDGRREPYIEPHFVELTSENPGRDPDFDELVEARWCEYLAEGYLRSTGSKLTAIGFGADETRINTPVQLYLAHSRLARAQLEIKIYSKLLECGSASLNQRFEHIKEQSFPKGGVFENDCEASPMRAISNHPPLISV